jgi:hypothetical protein
MSQFVIGGFYRCFPEMPYFYVNTASLGTFIGHDSTVNNYGNLTGNYTFNLPSAWCGFTYGLEN